MRHPTVDEHRHLLLLDREAKLRQHRAQEAIAAMNAAFQELVSACDVVGDATRIALVDGQPRWCDERGLPLGADGLAKPVTRRMQRKLRAVP